MESALYSFYSVGRSFYDMSQLVNKLYARTFHSEVISMYLARCSDENLVLRYWRCKITSRVTSLLRGMCIILRGVWCSTWPRDYSKAILVFPSIRPLLRGAVWLKLTVSLTEQPNCLTGKLTGSCLILSPWAWRSFAQGSGDAALWSSKSFS